MQELDERDEQPQFDPQHDALDTAGETQSVDVEMPSHKHAGGRGFAGMSPQKRRAIASKGGQSQGKGNNPGNFANDRQKAVAAGQKGGQHSHGGGRQSQDNNLDNDI